MPTMWPSRSGRGLRRRPESCLAFIYIHRIDPDQPDGVLAGRPGLPVAALVENFVRGVPKTGLFLSAPLAIFTNMCCAHTVRRTARVALRTTAAQRRRCYGLLRSAGDVWAWVIDNNRQLRESGRPQVANFSALCRALTGRTFGELSRHCAEAVLKNYSIAFCLRFVAGPGGAVRTLRLFEAAKRQKHGRRAGFPRRKRGLVPVRFRFGCFALDGSRVRLGVAKGAPGCGCASGGRSPTPPSPSARSPWSPTRAGSTST